MKAKKMGKIFQGSLNEAILLKSTLSCSKLSNEGN
jgi:hypothetical protein